MPGLPSLCTLTLYHLLSWFTMPVASAITPSDKIMVAMSIVFRLRRVTVVHLPALSTSALSKPHLNSTLAIELG